jgi:Fur family transcriptional regulator, zinc uptake regulator
MSVRERCAVEAQLDRAAAACAQDGGRLTELRRQVLGLILEAEGPLTAYQLLDRLKESRRGAAPPTVYRALDFLMEQRLIHKIERLNAFVSCTGAGHHSDAAQFLICRNCGTVTEIEDGAVTAALEHAAGRAGFHPATAVVEVEGICAACAHSS